MFAQTLNPMIKSIEYRDFSHALNLEDGEDKLNHKIAKHILSRHKFVLLMGFSETGKSTFMKYAKPRKNWNLSTWNRDNIMRPLFPDGNRIEKFYNYVDRFEDKALFEILQQPYRQLIVEGWNRMESRRRRYLGLAQQAGAEAACVVFDGPVERIIERCKESDKFGISGFELETFVKEKLESTKWPTFDEGWDKIYYLNTFGEEGAKYLSSILR